MVGNLPNLLTLTRILLLPFFAATLIYREYQYALLLYAAASITDLLDGYIARIKDQITYFGTILDPIADKFFIVTSFILMSNYDLIPKWLTIIVISKDIIVITGSIIVYFVINRLVIEPTFLGKSSSACQFIIIGIVLLLLNLETGYSVPNIVFILVAILTAAAGIDYVNKGFKAANTGDEQKKNN
jgi:cardiolipin synthase